MMPELLFLVYMATDSWACVAAVFVFAMVVNVISLKDGWWEH